MGFFWADFCVCFCGESDLGTVTVEAVDDVVSEILCVSVFFELTDGVAGCFWLNIGRALACSTFTSVLAWALGGVAPSPRKAKLMFRDIRDDFDIDGDFNAGFWGEVAFEKTGLTGVIVKDVGSIRRGTEFE